MTRTKTFIAAFAATLAFPAAASAHCSTMQGSFAVTCERGVQVYRHQALSSIPKGLSPSQVLLEREKLRASTARRQIAANSRAQAANAKLQSRALAIEDYRARVYDRNSRRASYNSYGNSYGGGYGFGGGFGGFTSLGSQGSGFGNNAFANTGFGNNGFGNNGAFNNRRRNNRGLNGNGGRNGNGAGNGGQNGNGAGNGGQNGNGAGAGNGAGNGGASNMGASRPISGSRTAGRRPAKKKMSHKKSH